jgi:hypothetical protein
MQRVWLTSKKVKASGFSVVEVLLAATIFATLSIAVIGAVVYGRNSTADSGERLRANMLAEEGLEATRNIRNAGYANLTDGTYGLAQSGGVWSLSGSADTSGLYSRSVTVAANGTNRKLVTSNISWSGVSGSQNTSATTQLTNWSASLTKSWATPSQYGGAALSGSAAGFKVATSGSYAYIVKNSSTGPNLFVMNISTPTNPTIVGSLTLTGTPTNIAVSGNYAYVSNSLSTAELQIVNIATPTTPTLAGTYNATGTAGGRGVYVVGSTVYLVRGANGGSDEFVVINAATPSTPTRITGYALNVDMNEVYVSGTVAFIATASDTQEVLVVNLLLTPILSLGTSINLPGTTDATTITGYGTNLFVGQGTSFYTINLATLLVPTVSGTVTLPGAINDITADSTRNLVFAGTANVNGEFQVINVSTLGSPSLYSSVNMTGSLNLTGVAYNATYDVVAGANSNAAQGGVVFGPN